MARCWRKARETVDSLSSIELLAVLLCLVRGHPQPRADEPPSRRHESAREWECPFGAKTLLGNPIDMEAETMWNGDTRLWWGCPQCEPAMQAAKPTTLP